MPVATIPGLLDSRNGPQNRSSRIQAQSAAVALTTPFGVGTTGLYTATAHGFTQGQEVQFDSIAGPTVGGAIPGQSYYISPTGLTANAFSLALTPDPAAPVQLWTTSATAGSLRRVTGSNIVASDQLNPLA